MLRLVPDRPGSLIAAKHMRGRFCLDVAARIRLFSFASFGACRISIMGVAPRLMASTTYEPQHVFQLVAVATFRTNAAPTVDDEVINLAGNRTGASERAMA